MRRSLITALSVLLAMGAVGAAQSKTMMMTQAQASQQIQDTLGTWTCKSAEGTHTATFTSILGGKGMRITENAMGGSIDTVVFDVKRQKWIDQHVDAQSYGVMEGTPVKRGIDFALVYPGRMNGAGTVRFPSKNTQVTNFFAVVNGKKVSMKETCTKS
jgi:hypothetical protein